MTTAVIGREEELGTIQTYLAEVDHGPSALVLSGEPGIGKTILWEAGVEEAAGRHGYVLTCRGVEAEASLSFAGLSELLAPVFNDVADSLLPPRRRALEVALLLVEPGEGVPDAHAIGLAVLDLLRALAERGSVGLSTVEAHLSHVYRKLGVRRAGLTARLAAPQGAPTKAGGEPVQT
jgi:predicted ATPase